MLKNNYSAKTHNALTVMPLLFTFFLSCKKDQSATNNSNQEYLRYHGDDKFLKGIINQLAERADTLDFTLIKGKDEFAWSKAIAYGQLGAKNSFILVPIFAQDKTVNTFARVTVLADRVINFKIHSFTAYQTTNDNNLRQILSTAASIFNKQGLILNSSVKPIFVPLNKQMSIGGAGNQAVKRSATNQNQICNATILKATHYTLTASPTRMQLFDINYVNEIKSILNILAGLGKFVITFDQGVGLQILGPDFEISQQAILEAKATVEARFADISFETFLITPQCFNITGGGGGDGVIDGGNIGGTTITAPSPNPSNPLPFPTDPSTPPPPQPYFSPIGGGSSGGSGGEDVPSGESSESDYGYTCPDNFDFSSVTSNELWQEGELTNIYCNLGIYDFMSGTISNSKRVVINTLSFGLPYNDINGGIVYTKNQAKAISADALNMAEEDMRKKYKLNPYLSSGQLADYWVARVNIRIKELTSNKGRVGRTGSINPSQKPPSNKYNPC